MSKKKSDLEELLGRVEVLDAAGDVFEISQQLLDSEGQLKLLKAEEYDKIPRESLRIWCHLTARYLLPTVELVEWVKERIGARKAIEIGSGHGDLGRFLGIHRTDSKIQDDPAVAARYEEMGQPRIKYPHDVEKLEALEAVEKYNPDVVVATWVTQQVRPTDEDAIHGAPFGVNEWALIHQADYLFIGNEGSGIHAHKRILKQPHETFVLPFIRSRAKNHTLERVWIWNKRKQ